MKMFCIKKTIVILRRNVQIFLAFLQGKYAALEQTEVYKRTESTIGKKNLNRALIVLALLISALILRGCYFSIVDPVKSKGRKPIPVGVLKVQKGDMPLYIKALGTVSPIDTVTIKTQINGRLVKVNFKEGQSVKKGDVLAEIDSSPYEAQLKQYEGQLLKDQALLENARLDLKRYKKLYAEDSISQQVLDTQASLVKQYEGTVKSEQGSWEADLWGSIRRQLESDEAAAQASFANLAVVKLSVQASLAQYYFQLRALDNVQFLLDEMVSLYEKFLAKIKSQYMAGTSSRLTVLQAESQLELARIQSADNKVNRSQYEHAIAALIGEPPAHFSIPPVQTSLVVPLIPIEIPSMLLERRPDIANAERLMAEQNALIGVSTAAYFPTLMLTGGRGYSTPSFRHLFSVPSLVWSLGVQLTETLFDAGARSAKIEAASESYQAAVATYRQTVLSAFQEVENYLVKSRIYEDESKMYHKAVRISENEYKYYLNGYNAGISSSLDVLNALFSFYTERKNEITLKSQQMVTAVGLIKALGGNWLDPQLGTVEQN